MDNLIKALQIFRKYSNSKRPTHCEHDVFMVCCVSPDDVSKEDIDKLDELGFFVNEDDVFISYRYGSC